jgi:prolyl-tRNA editing enzyme YbaK/EbsC (Cys-tRNA(Pro) deacylase)
MGCAVVEEVLQLAGVPYAVVARAPTARTVVLVDGDVVRLVVIPAGDLLDLERARRALRAGPRLRAATAAEVAEDFPGFDPAFLPPFGHAAVPEVVCLSLLYLGEVVLDGGVLIDPRDLLRLCEPRVADLCFTRRTGDRSPSNSARRPPSA